MGDQKRTEQPVEEERPMPKDVDMEPEDHVNRPDQPDFDPDEREKFDLPADEVLPTSDR